MLQEFPDARAKNKKIAHEISLKNSVTVSPAPSFVSLQKQKRGEFFAVTQQKYETTRDKIMKVQ